MDTSHHHQLNKSLTLHDFNNSIEYFRRFGHVLEPRRWWILLAFSLYNAGVTLAWSTYSALTEVSERYFDIKQDQLLLFSDTVLYFGFFLSYIGCWLAFRFFKKAILGCFFLLMAGAWMRYLAGSHYGVTLAGQTLIGVVSAPLFGFAMLIPDRWFSTKERFYVTTTALYSNYIGWALGYLLPCLIVGSEEKRIPLYTLLQALFMTLPFVIGIFFLEERPEIPPSYSAYVKANDQSSVWEELKALVKTPRFLASSLVFGLVLGISYSVSTVMSIFMAPLDISYVHQGIIGSSYVISGMITGLVGTIWIGKRGLKTYDHIIKILLTLSLLSLISLGILFFVRKRPDWVSLFFCNCGLGIGLIGLTPFMCSSIVESTFPVQESLSVNGIYMLGQLLSILASHTGTSDVIGVGGFLFMAILMFPCWIYGVFFYNTDYRKLHADEGYQSSLENASIKSIEIAQEREPVCPSTGKSTIAY